ncbi:uncharacterized protein LOC114261089 [Camellia sinensis]|uniref:uncharacterized protein LOC114261089 n=1 Tax=Camellia sinensis TaxID=4442 RepID=UPI001035B3E7|nr:uncharacterized protein LOC114261089 [Camellia sinensis]
MNEPVSSNSASPTKTQEEEDHLVRSTKKIKSKDHLETMDITESSCIPPTSVPVLGPNEVSTEGHKVKSFKEALAAPRNADFYFDDSMDSIRRKKMMNRSCIVHVSLSLLMRKKMKKMQPSTKKACIRPNKAFRKYTYRRNYWNRFGLQEEFNVIDLGNNHFLFKFSSLEDCAHVYSGGQWVIMDHYLTVRKSEPDFKASEAFETTTAVWVRFSELPIEYFQEKVLYTIARQIGTPLKINLTTAMAIRGRFARVCVEVDLRKPLCPRFLLGKKNYIIEYESIHSFCFYCGRVDHRKELCKYQVVHPKSQTVHRNNPLPERLQLTIEGNLVQTPTASPNANGHLQQLAVEGDDTYGPWMMVTKRTHKLVINKKTQSTRPSPTHNKFSELSKGTQQEEEMGRGKKTTRLGLEKEASSPYQKTQSGPSVSQTVTLAKASNSNQSSHSMPDNPSMLETDSTSLEIPMADLPSETPLILTPNLPTSEPLPLGSDGSTTTKHRKPPDPGIKYGDGGGHRSGGAYPPDGESSIYYVVRVRERSNLPRHYGMVDRADTDANRTKLEQQSRVSNPLCADGLHEIKGSRS